MNSLVKLLYMRYRDDTAERKPSYTIKVYNKEEARRFMAMFPALVRELTHPEDEYHDLPSVSKHLSKVC